MKRFLLTCGLIAAALTFALALSLAMHPEWAEQLIPSSASALKDETLHRTAGTEALLAFR